MLARICGNAAAPIAAAALLALPWGSEAAEGGPWGADHFPNIPLTTHDGRQVRFFDDLIEDRVVVLNFIFTSCKEVCPQETARLREVQKLLGDRVGKDVFMYSISIDPERDTPAVLAKYRERFGAGPGWTFLTGDRNDIVLLRQRLGLYNQEERTGNLGAHTLNMLIGNQTTGRWMKASPFDNPRLLATQIGSWLHNWKAPPTGEVEYADAPELREMSKGEVLFRSRCSSCHAIGGHGNGSAERPTIGPDLQGVTERRERTWLARFITEPDRMLAEGDPQAVALFSAYRQVRMPNFRLSPAEVQALIAYLEEAGKPAPCH